jgi:hypothetical protein
MIWQYFFEKKTPNVAILRENWEKKHATFFKFLQVVYILHARHQTPKMSAPKMWSKNAADLQTRSFYFCSSWLDVLRLRYVQERQLAKSENASMFDLPTEREYEGRY